MIEKLPIRQTVRSNLRFRRVISKCLVHFRVLDIFPSRNPLQAYRSDVAVFKNLEMVASRVEIVHVEAWGCDESAVERSLRADVI